MNLSQLNKKIVDSQNRFYLVLMINLVVFLVLGFATSFTVSIITIYLVLLLPLSVVYAYKSNYKTLRFLLFLMLFQNIILCVFSMLFTNLTTTMIIAYKELLAGLTVVFYVVYEKREIELIDIFSLAFIAILAISFFISPAPIKAKAVSARQLIIPMLLFYFGISIDYKKNEIRKIVKLILNLGIVIFVFGIVELVIGDKFLTIIGIKQFQINKGFADWANAAGIPNSFYAWDLSSLTGTASRRMASFILEPLSVGHYFVLCILLVLYLNIDFQKMYLKYVYITVYILGIMLTFSKGAILLLVIGVLVYFVMVKKYKKIGYFLLAASVAIFVAIVIFSPNKIKSVENHLVGLIMNFKSGNILLGNGLATSGNYAALYNKGNSNLPGESFIGTLVGQIGLIGLISYIGFNITIIIKSAKYNILPTALLLGVFIESFLSESSISFIGTGLFFIICGIYYKKRNLE